MCRKLPKLSGKENEVCFLLNYLKQQSGKTLLELEYLGHVLLGTLNKWETQANNHGGRQWSRWIRGTTQPKLELIAKVYFYVTQQLISGCWEENGTESLWAPLLPAVIDPKLLFIYQNQSTLLKILERMDEELVDRRLLKAIAAGYYIPNEVEIRKIFWSITDENKFEEGGNGFHIIHAPSETECDEMEMLMTDIVVNFGITGAELKEFASFAGKEGFAGEDFKLWAEQMRGQVNLDAQLLAEIAYRARHLYPRNFGLGHINPDLRIANLEDKLAFASLDLQKYSKSLELLSKTRMAFGVVNQLSYQYFLENHAQPRFGWDFPTVSIS